MTNIEWIKVELRGGNSRTINRGVITKMLDDPKGCAIIYLMGEPKDPIYTKMTQALIMEMETILECKVKKPKHLGTIGMRSLFKPK